MSHYVRVTNSNESDIVGIQTENDGTLSLKSIATLYPGATGLKYHRSGEATSRYKIAMVSSTHLEMDGVTSHTSVYFQKVNEIF